MVFVTGESPRQCSNSDYDRVYRRQDLHGHSRSEPRELSENVSRRIWPREPNAHGRTRSDARWGESTGAPSVQHAVAHDSNRRPRDRSRSVGPRAESQSAQCNWRRVMGEADEVRRHLVEHAHQHEDVEFRAEARRHHGKHEALHRFRRRQWTRRSTRGRMERRLGWELDQQPRCVLFHQGIS